MKTSAAVILVTTSFPVRSDGSEAAGAFVADLVEALAHHMPVRVVAPGPSAACEKWSSDVEVFRFPAPDKPLSNLKPWRPRDLKDILRVLAAGEEATFRAVRAGPAVHILALWALPSGHWARCAARMADIPYSVWTLGSDIWTLGRIPLVRRYLGRVLREAHCCYSDGLRLAEDTRRLAGRAVEFLPSSRRIDRVRTTPLRAEPPYRLLFLGRWHPNKGVDLLLDALGLLDEEDWQRIEAVEICGGGPMEALVRARVEVLYGAGRPVTMRGYLDKSAAEQAILHADYLLIPSRIESIPVVFSDAMQLRCPVVVTPVGDLPALTARGAGIVAAAVDASAYAIAIRRCLREARGGYPETLDDLAALFSMERVTVPFLCNAMARIGG